VIVRPQPVHRRLPYMRYLKGCGPSRHASPSYSLGAAGANLNPSSAIAPSDELPDLDTLHACL
jgi:hypothetical protein